MAYNKRRGTKGLYAKVVSLARSMSGEQRVVQDVVVKFASKGASVRNGELIRSLPQQFSCVPMGELNGRLYYWNGRYYEPMGRELFNDYVYRFMCSCNVQPEAFNVLPLIQDKCYDTAMCHRLKINPDVFIFKNGVMDLKTKTFTKDFTPDAVQINAVDYDYEVNEPLVWKDFLSQVLPDKPSQDTLQMFLGATLMSRQEAKLEKMLVLYGTGSNGKSVVFETVKGVLGEDSVSYFGINDFINENERGQSIASCNGRRLNYCSEIRAFLGKDVCDDTLKELISGEPMTVRPKYGKENITVREIPLLMANTNWNMARMDMSPALRRRITQLCFNVTVPMEIQDKRLHKKLEAEYAGIFAWIVDGMEKLRGNDYKFPDEEALPTPKEEYIEHKKVFGTLEDAVKQWCNYNNYGYKCRGERTVKFRMGQTVFFNQVRDFIADNGYMTTKLTLHDVIDAFKRLGGVITTSGGQKFLRFWATPDSVKRFREDKKSGNL